jgi:hypothetical protein
MYFNTAVMRQLLGLRLGGEKPPGITPAAPFVGDVTILPPAALVSLTCTSNYEKYAKRKRMTYSYSIATKKIHGGNHNLSLEGKAIQNA